MSEKTEIEEIRKQLEKVTLEIFNLCEKRLQLSKKIGELKANAGMPIENAQVEQSLKNKVLEKCRKQGLDENFSLNLLQLLLEESKRVQRDIIKSRR
ncbi:MAG: chorismate mutase [Candidatus Bathyarchaeia archaeon]|nr:chorismate mutase [Candidatus Bathyarchaeota archaeon]